MRGLSTKRIMLPRVRLVADVTNCAANVVKTAHGLRIMPPFFDALVPSALFQKRSAFLPVKVRKKTMIIDEARRNTSHVFVT
jgi:hypothetical protein